MPWSVSLNLVTFGVASVSVDSGMEHRARPRVCVNVSETFTEMSECQPSDLPQCVTTQLGTLSALIDREREREKRERDEREKRERDESN